MIHDPSILTTPNWNERRTQPYRAEPLPSGVESRLPTCGMSAGEITLVQDSFRLIFAIHVQAAELFYARLFAIDPATKPLFANTDQAAQGVKLLAAIGIVVRGLAQPASMLAEVRRLAVRHVAFGVRDSHYASVGAALLWTLEQGLGKACTPAILAAWMAAYTLLSATMIEASHAASGPAATGSDMGRLPHPPGGAESGRASA